MTTTTAARRLTLGLLTAPLALTLVACGGDGDDATAPVATTTVTASPSTSAPTTGTATGTATSAAPSPAETAGGAAGAGDDVALAAAETALAAVSGSRLYSLDRDDQGWDVSVITQDGTESDLEVSADGASVVRGPIEDTDDGDDRGDRDERARLYGATVDYRAALDAARGSVADGTLTGLDLDEEDGGTQRWEVQLGTATGDDDETTVSVDASSGAVLATERD